MKKYLKKKYPKEYEWLITENILRKKTIKKANKRNKNIYDEDQMELEVQIPEENKILKKNFKSLCYWYSSKNFNYKKIKDDIKNLDKRTKDKINCNFTFFYS